MLKVESRLEIADIEVTWLEHWLSENERNEKFVAQEELFKLEMAIHEKKLKMQAEIGVPEKKQETAEFERFGNKDAKTCDIPI